MADRGGSRMAGLDSSITGFDAGIAGIEGKIMVMLWAVEISAAELSPPFYLSQRHDVVCRCRNSDLASKNVEKHPHAPGIVQTIEDCELLGERPRH